MSRFDKGQSVFIRDRWFQIDKSSLHKNRPLLKLKGIDSVEAAESYKWEIVKASGEPELDSDEYMVSDLVGLNVKTDQGTALGEVQEILNYPAHDILVVGEVLIPLIKEFVTDINLESQTITVHLIPGMVSD